MSDETEEIAVISAYTHNRINNHGTLVSPYFTNGTWSYRVIDIYKGTVCANAELTIIIKYVEN